MYKQLKFISFQCTLNVSVISGKPSLCGKKLSPFHEMLVLSLFYITPYGEIYYKFKLKIWKWLDFRFFFVFCFLFFCCYFFFFFFFLSEIRENSSVHYVEMNLSFHLVKKCHKSGIHSCYLVLSP